MRLGKSGVWACRAVVRGGGRASASATAAWICLGAAVARKISGKIQNVHRRARGTFGEGAGDKDVGGDFIVRADICHVRDWAVVMSVPGRWAAASGGGRKGAAKGEG